MMKGKHRSKGSTPGSQCDFQGKTEKAEHLSDEPVCGHLDLQMMIQKAELVREVLQVTRAARRKPRALEPMPGAASGTRIKGSYRLLREAFTV